MSLLSWWPWNKAPRLPADSSRLPVDATRPAGKRTGAVNAGSNAQPVNRKGERIAQRELLYAVVRDAMVRAGVLSSSYKFKVLSLDSRGRQFMVMVDLSAEQAGSTAQLAEIEASIAQSAKSRHQITVTAVYWRRNEHVAVGAPGRPARRSRPATLDSGPVPLEAATAAVEPARAAPPRRESGAKPSFDPILPAEVEAFKRALSAGPAAAAAAAAMTNPRPATGRTFDAAPAVNARAFDGSLKHGPQSYTLLTGFEDTEETDAPVAALSGSQYGDLN